MEKANQIIDLHGNILKPRKGFKFWLKFPHGLFKNLILTRDRISGEDFILCINQKGKYYLFSYNISIDMYYSRELDYVAYDESKDIRYEWKYGSNSKKISQTSGNYGSSN